MIRISNMAKLQTLGSALPVGSSLEGGSRDAWRNFHLIASQLFLDNFEEIDKKAINAKAKAAL